MDPMTPSEFRHSAASEEFEDYEQYLQHRQARGAERTASAASRISANFSFQTELVVGTLFLLGLAALADDYNWHL